MTEIFDRFANTYFKKSSLEDCSLEQLHSFAAQYPYFSTAHYLLTKKLMKEDPAGGRRQFINSSIYYHNPLWVDVRLKDDIIQNQNSNRYQKQVMANVQADGQQEEEYYNDEIVYANRHSDSIEQPVTPAETKRDHEKNTASQNQPVDENRDLAFEPFHTVDYFASQGIKTVVEDKPKDRFGQQLKSFTDWLKTMKRLPDTEMGKTVTASSEEKVMSMAEHSIENREVNTESMAEVWIKQGQPEKAIEIYTKLSLINPSKSAYFAGLIENLKKH